MYLPTVSSLTNPRAGEEMRLISGGFSYKLVIKPKPKLLPGFIWKRIVARTIELDFSELTSQLK